MPTNTWTDTPPGDPTPDDDADTSDAGAEVASGRRTVLPRVETDGDDDRVVSDVLPRFEVERSLGRGGLGEVVAARDRDIGRQIAIKRVRPDRASQSAFLRFVREVRTVGRLDHPGIVPIHDVGRDDDGQLYFVMKLVEGLTLAELIDALRAGDPTAHAQWPFERRVAAFHRLLYAVSHAHEKGVVHRDIKPDNVMFGPHGQIQLLDWGIAQDREAGPAEPPGAMVGTPRYMAPEQARGEPVDERADTWALSLLLYEWLTLDHPAEGAADTEDVLVRIQTFRAAAPKDLAVHPAQGPVPPDLGWYVHDGLGTDPSARYPTVQAMIDRLDRRADGEIPVQCALTYQKAQLMRAQRLLDRHPLLFTLGTVLLCAAGTFALAGLAALGVFLLG